MRTRTVRTDDGVGLETVGQGAGTGILLVHGFSGAKEDFTDHFDRLARSHHVVAFDHRGHGASDKPTATEAYSIDRLAADTLAVADAYGFDRFRLLGHSMGGMVAQRVVLDDPGRVEALVLMSTWPGPYPGLTVAQARRAAAFALEHGIAALWEAQGGRDALTTPAHEGLLAERPGYAEFGDRKFLAQSPHMYAAMVEEFATRPDLSAELRTIRCPTLVIVGEQDAPALPGCVALAEVIPGARLARIGDAGHSPQFENAAAWAHTIAAFLREIDGRKAPGGRGDSAG